MKRLTMLPFIIAAFSFALSNEAFSQSAMKKEAVLKTADELQWKEIPGSVEGAMNSELWTDAKTGAHAAFTKFPAGFKAPLHMHTSDASIVVIKGAYVFNGKKYGPGSFLFVPGGQQHESGGAEDSETIFYMEQPGAFDINPVQKK